MRTNELLLYKHMEHEEILKDMTFLMENCQNDYYNKEDMAALLYECVSKTLELTGSYTKNLASGNLDFTRHFV